MCRFSLSLAMLVASAVTAAANRDDCAPGQLQLHIFNHTYANDTGAFCLDASPAGFYLHRNESSKDWVIFLEGGGLCVEDIDCWIRALGHHGSSIPWEHCTNGTNTFDADPRNPFVGINRVWVRYCSGDTWSGTSRDPNPRLGSLFTAGHLILEAVMGALLADHGLADAEKLLFTGGSAGGIGTMLNADYVTGAVPSTVKVMAAPQAGWFFAEGMELYPEWAIDVHVPLDELAVDYVAAIQEPFLDESCVEAQKQAGNDTRMCWDASVHYPYIDTPLFVAENRFDSCQIFQVLQAPSKKFPNGTHPEKVNEFVEFFGGKMNQSLTRHVVEDPRPGTLNSLFVPSCLDHTNNLCTIAGPLIQNQTLGQALWEWFQGGGRRLLVDECSESERGQPCQKVCTCPNGT